MKDHRLRCFFTDKIRTYLPDSEVRKLAHKQYKKWALERATREDQEETPLNGVHIFVGLDRDQRPGAISKCQLRKIVKQESQRKTKEQLLAERWDKVKIELAMRFEKEGNAHFINECRKTEKSRKRKTKMTKASKSKVKLTEAIA
jgi:hypothetical protein